MSQEADQIASPTLDDVMREAARLDAAQPGATPAANRGDPAPASQDNDAQPAAGAKPGAAPDDPQDEGKAKSPAPADKPADEQGKPKPEETPFAKAKSERERRDRSWQALDREKEEFRQDKAALTARVQGMERELAQLRRRPAGDTPAKDTRGLTVADYAKLEQRYRAAGNDEMAEAAREAAEELRAKPAAPERSDAPASFDSPEFQAEWNANYQQLVHAEPALADPANPVNKAATALVQDPTWGRFFKAFPDGNKAAVDLARILQANSAAQETHEKLTTAEGELKASKAEIARLNGLLQPRGGQPGGPPAGARRITDLSPADAEQEIGRLAAEVDAAGIGLNRIL